MPLRVVPAAPITSECGSCSRRDVLQGFAMTAAAALVGCQANSVLAPDAGPNSTTAMCGTNLCLDLNDPMNAMLTMVDGSMVVSAPSDKILVMRTSTTVVQAVSDICTHAGCGVRYDQAGKVITCPCHGSRYSLAGAVLRGPASRPLKNYQTQLDKATKVLTIML